MIMSGEKEPLMQPYTEFYCKSFLKNKKLKKKITLSFTTSLESEPPKINNNNNNNHISCQNNFTTESREWLSSLNPIIVLAKIKYEEGNTSVLGFNNLIKIKLTVTSLNLK